MKKFAVALVLMSATSAFACPNLSGSYMCPAEDGSMTAATTLTQSEVNGVTTYQMTDAEGVSEFIADGLTRTAAGKVESGNDAVINVTNTCAAEVLVMDATYVEKDATGATVVEAVLQQNVSLDASANLSIGGTYVENGGAVQTFQSTCTKQ